MEPHIRGSVAAVTVFSYFSMIRLGRESERYESLASCLSISTIRNVAIIKGVFNKL